MPSVVVQSIWALDIGTLKERKAGTPRQPQQTGEHAVCHPDGPAARITDTLNRSETGITRQLQKTGEGTTCGPDVPTAHIQSMGRTPVH